VKGNMHESADRKRLAQDFARRAHDTHSDKPYGGIYSRALHGLCIYNNRVAELSGRNRDRQVTSFRVIGRHYGVREIAYAESPESGCDEGSTYALLVDISEDGAAMLYSEYLHILSQVR